MANWLILLGLTLRWQGDRREPDDSDWFAFAAFVFMLPVIVTVLSPYLFYTWLVDNGADAVARWSVTGLMVTMWVGTLLVHLWAGLAFGFIVGLVSLGLIAWVNRGTVAEEEEPRPSYWLSS